MPTASAMGCITGKVRQDRSGPKRGRMPLRCGTPPAPTHHLGGHQRYLVTMGWGTDANRGGE